MEAVPSDCRNRQGVLHEIASRSCHASHSGGCRSAHGVGGRRAVQLAAIAARGTGARDSDTRACDSAGTRNTGTRARDNAGCTRGTRARDTSAGACDNAACASDTGAGGTGT